jgi:hypothetical protein
MADYLARYLSGECEAVCGELTSLCDGIRTPGVNDDAVRIAVELVDRSYRNLRKLADRLTELGYLFKNKDDVLTEAAPTDLAVLDDLESNVGTLPIVARKWYERFRSVDFTQDDAQLFSRNNMPRTAVSGLGMNAPLVFLSIPNCLRLRQELADARAEDGTESRYESFLPLGSWASNCTPVGFRLPCDAFDATYYNDGGGDVTFIESLRGAFRWGGFPLWHNIQGKKRKHMVPPAPDFEAVLPTLIQDLEPI